MVIFTMDSLIVQRIIAHIITCHGVLNMWSKDNDLPAPSPTVTTQQPLISSMSGIPCTFWGGMKAAANGCLTGVVTPTPSIAGCVTGAFTATATHTIGCIDIVTKPESVKVSTEKMSPKVIKNNK